MEEFTMNALEYFEAWHKDHLNSEGMPNDNPHTCCLAQGFDIEQVEHDLADYISRWSFNGMKRSDFVIFRVVKNYTKVL